MQFLKHTRPAVVHQVHTVIDSRGALISKSGRYLVVAEVQYENGRSAIWARRYDDDLVDLTLPFSLTPSTSAFSPQFALNAEPAVASFPTSSMTVPFGGNGFLAAWEKTASSAGDPDGIYGAALELFSPTPPPVFAIATSAGSAAGQGLRLGPCPRDPQRDSWD